MHGVWPPYGSLQQQFGTGISERTTASSASDSARNSRRWLNTGATPKGKHTLQYELRETGLDAVPEPASLPPKREESRLTTASGGDAVRATASETVGRASDAESPAGLSRW
jgi:hypothetical protein